MNGRKITNMRTSICLDMVPNYEVKGYCADAVIKEITRLSAAMKLFSVTGVYGEYTVEDHYVSNFDVKVRAEGDQIIIAPTRKVDYFALRGGLGQEHYLDLKAFNSHGIIISESYGRDPTGLVNFGPDLAKRVQVTIDKQLYVILDLPNV